MKIILLSDANSIHTLRWIESLTLNNFEIRLFSFFKPERGINKKYKKLNVKVISPDLRSNIKNLREPNISKIKYLQAITLLKKTIKIFGPNIIHAHYASSYGVLGFLSRFKPFVLSVWGSDIYYFPYIKYLKPKRTLFTHMTALLDQKDLISKCPENVEPAYDGLEVVL